MENQIKELYHIHRKENIDEIWYIGNKIVVDDHFDALFWTELSKINQKLWKRYGDYDIDYMIAIMEEMKYNDCIEEKSDFNSLLKELYFLRRELALEEGRKLYNPTAPSRLHSIFLTDLKNIDYWKKIMSREAFDIFKVKVNGNLFESSDKFFLEPTMCFDTQVEKSKDYWNPKMKVILPRKELLFQGECQIIK